MPAIPIIGLAPAVGGQKNYGIITYGDYTFSPFRNLSVQCEPVYDEADRVVTHLKYTLRCFDCVLQNDVQDIHQVNMTAMQVALTTPGLNLRLQDIGFDSLLDTTIAPDVVWGPKPRMLAMRPHGEICWSFDWEVEFCVSRCVQSAGTYFQDGVVLAWNFEVSFTVGENGIVQQRTTSGYVQVMAVHGKGAQFDDVLFNVDKAWDKLSFPLPYGFRRLSNHRSVNKAKNRIDFTIIDEEFPGAAYPPGIVNCEARMDLKSNAPGLQSWTGTLRASYEVAPGFPKSLAVSKFLTLLNDRATRIKKAAIIGNYKQPTVIPVQMAISHDLYSRSTDLAVSFLVTTSADALLENSGMWQPLPENDWQAWYDSLVNAKVLSNRGYSGLGFDPSQDQLVTICFGSPPAAQVAQNNHDTDGKADENTATLTDQQTAGNYAHYENRVRQVRTENFVVHRPAQNYYPGYPNAQDNQVEYQGAPDNYVVMTGRAIRVDQLPEPPQILTVGGKQVELVKKFCPMDDKPMTLAFGHKLYSAEWELWYRVKGDPTVPNPAGIAAVVPVAAEPLETPTV